MVCLSSNKESVGVHARAEAGEEWEGVLLDVGGMKCGGCSAAVKRILAQRPEVASLAVNLLTESALVQVKPGVAAERAQLAQDFADTLTAKVPGLALLSFHQAGACFINPFQNWAMGTCRVNIHIHIHILHIYITYYISPLCQD